MGPDFSKPQILTYDIGMGILAGAADMRRGDQFALLAVAPAVIGAADHTCPDVFLFFNQDHSAVSAGVLEHIHGPVLVAHQQQRHAQKIDRRHIACIRNVLGKTDR